MLNQKRSLTYRGSGVDATGVPESLFPHCILVNHFGESKRVYESRDCPSEHVG